jgi:hypothetical protein
MRWWCCPPALPRPPGCLRCLPTRPWPALTCPRFLRLCFSCGRQRRGARQRAQHFLWHARQAERADAAAAARATHPRRHSGGADGKGRRVPPAAKTGKDASLRTTSLAECVSFARRSSRARAAVATPSSRRGLPSGGARGALPGSKLASKSVCCRSLAAATPRARAPTRPGAAGRQRCGGRDAAAPALGVLRSGAPRQRLAPGSRADAQPGRRRGADLQPPRRWATQRGWARRTALNVRARSRTA